MSNKIVAYKDGKRIDVDQGFCAYFSGENRQDLEALFINLEAEEAIQILKGLIMTIEHGIKVELKNASKKTR